MNRTAFDTVAEADLVDALRQQARPIVSLVAIEGEAVIGHILFSCWHGVAPFPKECPKWAFCGVADWLCKSEPGFFDDTVFCHDEGGGAEGSGKDWDKKARIIAANNILNALFMIASAGMAALLLKAGLTVPQLFLITGLLNLVVAGYIFLLVPEYLLRFVAWVATRFVYRFKVRGDEHIPTEGAAILVCNHVSFVDAILLMAASPRPVVFAARFAPCASGVIAERPLSETFAAPLMRNTNGMR